MKTTDAMTTAWYDYYVPQYLGQTMMSSSVVKVTRASSHTVTDYYV